MMLRSTAAVLVAAGAAVASEGVSAADIGPQTPCQEVRGILDAPDPDKDLVGRIGATVAGEFAELDQRNAERGEARTYATITPEGRMHMGAAVLIGCGERPGETLRQAVEAIYAQVEALRKAPRKGAP